MNIQKFTQKSVEAINDCEKLAYEYGNQEIEQEHLLVALLRQEDGLILKLIEKMEINKEYFLNSAESKLAERVKVSGGQVYIGQDLNKVLISAEDEAKRMGDEYVSVACNHGLCHDACLQPGYLPDGYCNPEPGAAQTFPRQTGVRHQLHALHRRRDAGIHGKTWLPHR